MSADGPSRSEGVYAARGVHAAPGRRPAPPTAPATRDHARPPADANHLGRGRGPVDRGDSADPTIAETAPDFVHRVSSADGYYTRVGRSLDRDGGAHGSVLR